MSDFFQLEADEQSARLTGLAVNALSAWGVTDCAPRLLKFRENAVFEVQTQTGARAALRVHRQGYHDDASLEAELTWMAMLAKDGMCVPTPVAAQDGRIAVDATAAGVPGIWKVDMLAWVEGKQLGDVGEPLEFEGRDPATLFHDIGKTMGTLHNLTTAWPQQNQLSRQAWDRDGFVGDQPLWGQFWELAGLTPDQKALLLQAKDAIAQDLDAYGQTPENYGLIHADLVPENVMLDQDQIVLIDFDDAGYGWHMFEIVTAIYWLSEEPAADTIAAAVLEGYQSVRILAARDLATLDLFTAARALTYVGWVHTRSDTETAIEMTPFMIERAVEICGAYLRKRGA